MNSIAWKGRFPSEVTNLKTKQKIMSKFFQIKKHLLRQLKRNLAAISSTGGDIISTVQKIHEKLKEISRLFSIKALLVDKYSLNFPVK